jgi:hypothetical protein
MAGGLIGLFVLARQRVRIVPAARPDTRARDWALLLFASYVVAYLVLLIVPASVNVDVEDLQHRYLGPVFVPLLLLFALVTDDLVTMLPRTGRWRVARAGLIGLLGLWLVYPARQTTMGNLREYLTNGPGAYGTRTWRQSQLISYLQEHELGSQVATNQSPLAYATTGRMFADSPRKVLQLPDGARPSRTELDAALASGDPVYLVWFSGMTRLDLYSLDELRRWYRLVEVASFDDGAVYAVSAAGP